MGIELTAGVIAAMVSAAASVVSLAMTLSMKPKGPEVNDSGSSIDRKGQNNPKVVPFGRCVVPAVRVWNNVNNQDTKYLGQVYSFGVGPIMKFEQVYIDGVNYFGDNEQPNAGGWYGMKHSAEFPNVQTGLRLGNHTETAYSQLFGHSDNEWTSAHRGDRIASAGLLVERWINKGGDNDIRFVSDRAQLEAMIHGNAVIDPRFSVFERAWVNQGRDSYRNPACVLFTYLVDNYYGLGLPVDAININDFIELANYCDANALRFDGYIDQGDDFGAIILDMCTSFDGIAYVEDGVVRVKADKLSYPVCHVTEDDMVGSFKLSNVNDSSYYNVVNVEFVNEVANNTVDKYVLPKDVLNNPTIIADGFEKAKDLKLPYTSAGGDFRTIRNIANKHLLKARYQQTIEFDVDNTLKSFKVYDVIEVTNSDYGLNKAQFRVVKIETTLDDKTTISKVVAEQYEPSIYDIAGYDDGITSPPIKPPTTKIPSPVGLKFELTGFSLSGQGKLSWTTRYNRECRSVVEYKLASTTSWKRAGEVQLDEYNFNNLRPDTYDFRVLTKNFMGSTSEWTELKGVQIKGGLVLPTITGLKSNFTNETCIISWDDMKVKPLNIVANEVYDGVKTVADVFSHYEVIVYKGDTPKYTETLSSDSNVFTYTYDMNVKSGVNRSLKFEVRVVAVDGSEGKVAAVTAKNAQVEQASGVEVSGKLVQLNARWDQPKDKDYSGTDIHISSVSNFTPSASTLVETTTGCTVVIQRDYEGMHYMRIGHYDKFGKDGMVYSAPQGFVMQDIDDLLDNSNSFDDVLTDISGIVGDIGDIDKELAEVDKEINQAQADIAKAKTDIINNASEIKKTNTTVATQGAKIEENKQAITSTNGNLAEYKTSVTAEFNGVKANITANQTAIADDKKALADYKTSVAAEFNGVKANITANQTAIADDKKALADYKTVVKADFDKANAAINSNKTAIADDVKALADYKTSVTAELNGVKASVTQNSQAIAGVDGKVDAMHTIKLESGNKVSGIIMANDGVTSTFDVIADKFRVSSKAGDQAVFQVNATSGEVIMRNALIKDLTATNIKAGSITGNSIASNTKIVAGAGNTSASLDGTGEWRIYAGNTNGAAAPFRVAQSGALVATNANITGHIVANSGTFTGTINAGAGNFSGAVYCQNGAYISGHPQHHFLHGPNGNFHVDAAGNMYAKSGRFEGTVYADKIEGDVIRAAVLQQTTDQTISFPAWHKPRTVVINGVTLTGNGGRYETGGGTQITTTGTAYGEFNINGNVYQVAASGNGSTRFSRPAGHSITIPAGHAITVRIRFWGETGQNASWTYDVRGAVVMVI